MHRVRRMALAVGLLGTARVASAQDWTAVDNAMGRPGMAQAEDAVLQLRGIHSKQLSAPMQVQVRQSLGK